MKPLISLIAIFLLAISCENSSGGCALSKHFDVKEYRLIEIKKDSQGAISMELYQNISDSTRFFTQTYWSNGNLQGAIFYTRKQKDGPFRMYDIDGRIAFEGMYIDDLQNGLTLYYKMGEIADFSIFYKGQELPIDSLSKKTMFNFHSDSSDWER